MRPCWTVSLAETSPPSLTPLRNGEGGIDVSRFSERGGSGISESPSPLRGGVRDGGGVSCSSAALAAPISEGGVTDKPQAGWR